MTEAKNEVMERKKDLDTTKEKMDKLVEKLYLGRSAVHLPCPLLHAACPLIDPACPLALRCSCPAAVCFMRGFVSLICQVDSVRSSATIGHQQLAEATSAVVRTPAYFVTAQHSTAQHSTAFSFCTCQQLSEESDKV